MKKIILIAFAFILCVFAMSCANNDNNPVNNGITISAEIIGDIILEADHSRKLFATLKRNGVEDKNLPITWTTNPVDRISFSKTTSYSGEQITITSDLLVPDGIVEIIAQAEGVSSSVFVHLMLQ